MPAKESSGEERSPLAGPAHWLDIGGQVYRGVLLLDWSFDPAIYRRETVEQLAELYKQALIEVIEHCTSGASGVTPSDFELVRLSQADLDRLPVPAAAIEDIYPLTPMQQGMLFHALSEPEASVYVTQLSADLEGLSPLRFKAALQAVVDRYEILRTGFVWGEALSEPLQVVEKRVALPLEEHDFRGLEGVEARLAELRAAEHARGVELARPTLLRIVLVRLDERRYHLIWTSHHILLDGWSFAQLLGEIVERYAGSGPPAAPPGRYRDYIAWLKRQAREVSEQFWRRELAPLEAPTRIGSAIAAQDPGVGHGSVRWRPRPDQMPALQRFAQEQRLTLNTVVQGVWSLLLQRYTGQQTVVFGATVAGRPADLPGAESLLGLFINTLPVVLCPRGDQRVGEWLRRFRPTTSSCASTSTPLSTSSCAGRGGPDRRCSTASSCSRITPCRRRCRGVRASCASAMFGRSIRPRTR